MTRSRPPAPTLFALTLCALALALSAGCGGSEPAEQPAAPGAGETPSGQAGSSGRSAGNGHRAGDPPAVPTLSSRGTPAAPSPGSPPEAAGLHFEIPSAWEQQPPSSSMRLAQARIPGPGGPGELTVFFFGVGGGGAREDNIERWIGQVEVTGEPRRESFQVGGLTVTWVDVSGTLLPSGMGMGPTEPQPGSRLFGAVVEGPGGPWFFKATGPQETLAAARDDFMVLLKSLRPAQG